MNERAENVALVALGLAAACFLAWIGSEELAIAIGSGTIGYMSKAAPRAAAQAATMLLVLFLAMSTSGCTPSQWIDAMHVIKPVSKFTCALANALCVKGSDDVACAAIAATCGIVEPLLDAVPTTLPATSGDEEPHDLSVED
jgi:hypothetical protein